MIAQPTRPAGDGLRARAWASEQQPVGRALRVAGVATAVGLALVSGLPLCPFALVTRHPCPGCGLTRAAFALARGDVHGALHLHPLSVVLVPLVGLALTYNAVVYVKEGRVAAAESLQGAWITRLGLALAAVVLAVWIARFFGAFGGPVPV